MQVSIAVPDDVISKLQSKWKDLSRYTLEALAVESYRAGVITEAEVQRMLNFSSRWETDDFLKRSNAYIYYTETDLQNDINCIRKLTSG